jgi:type III restriction enzyme
VPQPLTLKTYQQDALDALRAYLALARERQNASTAFYEYTERTEEAGRSYRRVTALPDMPFVCLRVPTGGGKTLVACHALAVVADELLRSDRTVAVYLAPSTAIVEQTLAALRNPNHPYRLAVEKDLRGGVTVCSVAEALHLSPGDLASGSVIVVATLAAFRRESTEGLKVYEDNGSLMAHFAGLSEEATAGLEPVEGTGKPKTSLANLLALHRPVVISDEAHTARTELSFETLARLRPCAVVEITATPRPDSNVIFRVSAAELKAAQMIKLPVCFETHREARAALAATIDRRNTLEVLANDERQLGAKYLRPIALLQCEADVKTKADPLTPARVRQMLIENAKVPAEQIAIEVGGVAEIADWEKAHGKTLFDESCPIRFVLTVNKLREGWDCPFAYVLCSVAELGTAAAVEQVLGRVLRQPGGKWRGTRALNVAYAYVTSENFTKTANSLKDALVASGFEEWEAAQAVARLTPSAKTSATGHGVSGGAVATGDAGAAEGMPDLTPAFEMPAEAGTPAARGERCVVPVLCRRLPDGATRRLTEADFEPLDFSLANADVALSEAEFPPVAAAASSGVIDIESTIGAAVRTERTGVAYFTALQRQLQLLFPGNFETADDVARYLDYAIPHKSIPQSESLPYLKRLVEHLVGVRNFQIADLDRERVRLKEAAGKKMNGLRKAARDARFQEVVFGADAALSVGGDTAFTFDPDVYPAKTLYAGARKFRKHYYATVGKMNGEETDCAALLDELPRVSYWLRNLEANRAASFWFPTATDYTYPDFIAVLDDGRVAAIEYKGGNLLTTDDTKEKESVGNLWAEASGGSCVYLLVGATDYAARLQQLAG